MENIKPLESFEWSSFAEKYSPYIKEVRRRLISTLVVFFVAAAIGLYFYEDIIALLVRMLSLKGVNIVFTSPFQFINLAISCGLVSGIVAVIPIVILHILRFLRPALKIKEFKTAIGFVPYSLLLFLIGFTFGAVIMKWQIEIFLTRAIQLGIGNILDISGLLNTILLTSALMGVGFQFPIVLLLLMRLGVISSKQLSSKRPWVYLGSFVFSLFLPPDSILADILLTLPLVILFEVTLLINFLAGRKRKTLASKSQLNDVAPRT